MSMYSKGRGREGLTHQQELFVAEYLVDLDGANAARRAGYTHKNAGAVAHKMLQQREIRDAVEAAIADRVNRVKVDADYVLQRHIEIDQMDVVDILDDAGGVLPINKWPKVWRTSLCGYKVQEAKAQGVGGLTLETVVKELKWPDKLRNLKQLGDHTAVQAYREQIGVSGDLQLRKEIGQIMEDVDGETWGLPDSE